MKMFFSNFPSRFILLRMFLLIASSYTIYTPQALKISSSGSIHILLALAVVVALSGLSVVWLLARRNGEIEKDRGVTSLFVIVVELGGLIDEERIGDGAGGGGGRIVLPDEEGDASGLGGGGGGGGFIGRVIVGGAGGLIIGEVCPT